MAKFNKKPGSRGSGKEEKSNYKAKRSFSKNKSLRDGKTNERPRRSFSGPGESREKTPAAGRRKESYERPAGRRREGAGFSEEKDYSRDAFSARSRKGSWDGPRRREDEDSGRERRPKKEFKPKEDKFDGFKHANKSSGERGKKQELSAAPGKKRRLSKPRKLREEDSTQRINYEELEEGRGFSRQAYGKAREKSRGKKAPVAKQGSDDGMIRLNKYLSNAGIASRREADNLILSGVVKVNGIVVDQLGTRIKPTDKVTYADSAVKTERKIYLLLNKPKDYITTVDDPRERKTVMDLVRGACKERIYPVGRLDRNTTGLLLLTNDGELTTKLTHPKFGIKKVYHVSLNKGLKADDFKAIVEGIELEDGLIKADDLAFVGEGKKEVGIEIHSGRNRIVRRIFEHLGYDVLKLDRVVFAGLTKKDLPRGKHRFLTAKEVGFLQMIG